MAKKEAGIGHNSGETFDLKIDGPTRERLIDFCERLQNIDEEIKTLRGDRSDVLAELKIFGYNKAAFTKAYKEYQKSKQPPKPAEVEKDALSQMYLDVLLSIAEI